MITMLLGGLWHGASWTFVFWGGLHGAYLCFNHGWHACKRRCGLPQLPKSVTRPPAILLTFTAVVIGWVFFRAETFSGALTMLQSMFGMLPVGAEHQALYGNQEKVIRWIAGSCLVVWFLPNVMQLFDRFKPSIDVLPEYTGRIAWSPNIIWLVFVLVVMYEATGSLPNISEFLYFQF